MPFLHGLDIVALVAKRVSEHANVTIDAEIWADVIRQHSPNRIWANMKTWIGAWTTSYRLHEVRRQRCVFGCAADDSWLHYVDCGGLWGIVFCELGMVPMRGLEERICLLMCTHTGIIATTLAFKLYNEARARTRHATGDNLEFDELGNLVAALHRSSLD